MRRLLLLAGLTGALGAQAPHRILSVERRGLPPFEASERIYVLEGGADRGLRVGHRLALRRPGSAEVLGHFRVTGVREAGAEARFERSGPAYPLKGDLAWRDDLAALPRLPELGGDPLPTLAPPDPAAEAPPQEGLLFFLPQRADLSPAGQRKLQAWVEAWGASGRWTVQVPVSRALRPPLQKQRAESLQAALRALGVDHAAVDSGARTAEGKYDPAWIRHSD